LWSIRRKVKLLPRSVIIAFILEEQLFERDFADSN